MAGNLTAMIASIFSGGVTADPYYEYTTLLLPGNGTNGAQNNTFLDGSSNNFTITRNGNTTQGTFSPFSQTGWGNYFGSSTANLKFASVASFAIGTGNFSIECFVNFTAWSGTNQRICIQGVSGTTNVQIARDSGANDLFVDIQGSRVITYAWTPTIGQWYHIAVVRSGTGSNQVALYIDGTSVATGTSSASIAQNQFLIGGLDWASGYSLQGYISNFRYSNVARTITLPTSAYTSDANTLILTCQSNRFIDNSASPKTITVNGSPSVQAFSPFNPTASWSAATNGGSGYFDGNADFLTTPVVSAFAFGTGNFTVEAWVYVQKDQPWTIASSNYNYSSGTGNWAFYVSGNIIYFNIPGQNHASNTITITKDAWSHVAYVRSGTSGYFYLNGKLVSGAITDNANYSGTTGTFYVGRQSDGTAQFQGYMNALRIVKGTAVYTGEFTPPTAPITNAGSTSAASYPSTTNVNTSFASSECSLLLNFTNAGIYDATSKNDLETVGNAQISTAISAKWGGSSIYLNGSDSWLIAPFNTVNDIGGTAPFTIEFWSYFNSLAAISTVVGKTNNSTAAGSQFEFTVQTNGQISVTFYYSSSAFTVTSAVGAITTGAWQYVAMTKDSSGNYKIFINGTQSGTTVTNTSTLNTPTLATTIGAQITTGNRLCNAYFQDFRITRGVARTITASPTAAFPTL